MVLRGQIPPCVAAFPILLPPLEDSLLIALCKNPWVFPGEPGGVLAGCSWPFFSSLALADVAVPEELVCSTGGLLIFLEEADSGDLEEAAFEPDEKLDFRLDTHEVFLLDPGLWSFGLFPVAGETSGESAFS